MNINFDNRTRKLTNTEFSLLPRQSNGDIHEDLFIEAWIWSTEKQREDMTADDQTRGDDLEEELRCMRADEFGA